MSKDLVIFWFRQDLRLADNPALHQAAQQGIVAPIYILDDMHSGAHKMGAATRCWLYHSLKSLNTQLRGKLLFAKGDATQILLELVNSYQVKAVYWNRCYEPWRIARDINLQKKLQAIGTEVYSTNGSLLWEPWQIKKKDDSFYKVFTPFYRKALTQVENLSVPLHKPSGLKLTNQIKLTTALVDLELLPSHHWDKSVLSGWAIGEDAASFRLKEFLGQQIKDYKKGRDFPAEMSISRLSPHLHFGEISPLQIWYEANKRPSTDNVEHFLRELCWREFSYHLLYHFPDLPNKNFQKKFNHFPWRKDKTRFEALATGANWLSYYRCWDA